MRTHTVCIRLDQLASKTLGAEATSPSLRDLCYYLAGKSCRVMVRFPWPALPSTVAPWVRGKRRSEWSNLGHKVQSRQSQICARGNEPRRQRSLLQPGQWRWVTCVKALEVQEGGRAIEAVETKPGEASWGISWRTLKAGRGVTAH